MMIPEIELPSIEDILAIARSAGREIMTVFQTEITPTFKKDKTPVTKADLAAHNIIITRLSQLTPHIPVLSEESAPIPYKTRKTWQAFWLVDPLDGTKEFLKHSREFTVNIALIENNTPVLGVIHAPALNLTYYASRSEGAFKQNDNSGKKIRLAKKPPSDFSTLRIIGSSSHRSKGFEKYVKKMRSHYNQVQVTHTGSSLKFGLIAENKADVYPRLSPTSEWDTAAGHAVAKYAGRSVINLKTKEELLYNKKNLSNPEFLVV